MIYNTKNDHELKKMKTRAKALIKKGAVVDLTEKKPKRTIDQNSYVHVLFGLYGIENGFTLVEVKNLVKNYCPFMKYEKKGEKFPLSTSQLDVEQMTRFIEWFRTWSAQKGCYLPTPDEYRGEAGYFEQQIRNASEYL